MKAADLPSEMAGPQSARKPDAGDGQRDMNTGTQNNQVVRVSPMLAVEDIQKTLEFYSAVLGFSVVMTSPDYAIVARDGATIHFMKAADESVMAAVRGHASIYIEVADIASLWAHVSTFKGRYRIKDLFQQPYGMTEFHIDDPNECLVFVGQKSG